ncbi:WxL protein peptidoglycan domain-containing protein [Oerskovia flava]|uniref:WxL protein peptidoglycan domain-containing protein n=1 Tax=Oerskovia flava TaxID=2986422 RepID=UPI0022407D32|nr:DUF916 domain-containing protein [Oerskovia sp. JB1-3-2]
MHDALSSPRTAPRVAARSSLRAAARGRRRALPARLTAVTAVLTGLLSGGGLLGPAFLAPAAGTTVAPAAVDDVSWGLAPAENDHGSDRANFSYGVEPGDHVADALVVTNHSDVPLDLQVYAADAFTTTSGQLDLLTSDQESVDLGAWIDLGPTAVRIEPGEVGEIPFTLTVPDDARPGDHSGGVITSLVQATDDSTVALDRRLALRVHARVAGVLSPGVAVTGTSIVHHGSPNPFGTSTATVRYAVTNTGNARLVPGEQVDVVGPLGWGRRTLEQAELPELLPGSTMEREVTVTGVRPFVRAEAQVEVTATAVGIGGGAATRADASSSTWAVPWAALALLLLVVAGTLRGPALLAAARTARARRSSVPAAAAPAVPAGPAAPEQALALTEAELAAALERARAEGRAQALAEKDPSTT